MATTQTQQLTPAVQRAMTTLANHLGWQGSNTNRQQQAQQPQAGTRSRAGPSKAKLSAAGAKGGRATAAKRRTAA